MNSYKNLTEAQIRLPLHHLVQPLSRHTPACSQLSLELAWVPTCIRETIIYTQGNVYFFNSNTRLPQKVKHKCYYTKHC